MLKFGNLDEEWKRFQKQKMFKEPIENSNSNSDEYEYEYECEYEVALARIVANGHSQDATNAKKLFWTKGETCSVMPL